MCKACEIGKIVVNKCLSRKLFINTQKLQKLLVLMDIECISHTGHTLFDEDVRIWNCGVAIKEVDVSFRQYALSFNEPQIEYIALLDSEHKIIDEVLSDFGELDALEINNLEIIQKMINKFKSKNQTHISKQERLQEFMPNDN